MKNNFTIFLKFFIFLFLSLNNSFALDQFNFEIAELEITNNGNKYYGYGDGTATTIDGKTIIKADKFEYDKIRNILIATENVVLEDKINEVILYTQKLTYFKNQERFITENETKAKIQSKYEIVSKNIEFLRNKNQISSNFFTTIKETNLNLYELDKFSFLIENKILKGENIKVIENYSVPIVDTDQYKFSRGIFDLSSKEFLAEETKINLKNDIFDIPENKPRLYGSSSKKKGDITTINNGVFTSCGTGGDCPSWKIESKKRAGNRCEGCGVENGSMCECCGTKITLHCHHLKSFAKHPELRFDPENSEVLCPKCHYSRHNGKLGELLERPTGKISSQAPHVAER